MKNFELIDDETGIKQYPGYVGMIWAEMPSDVASIAEFDWRTYDDLVPDVSVVQGVSYTFDQKKFAVAYSPSDGVASLRDQLQTLEVQVDRGQSPTGN